MRYIFTTFIFFLSSSWAISQSSVRSGTLDYNGAKYPCEIIEYPLPPGDAETVIKDQMREKGYNQEKGRNFIVYRNVKINDLNSNESHDLVFKVERKSRKESDISLVSLVTANPGEIPNERVKGGGKGIAVITTSSAAGAFLESFQPAVTLQAFNLSVLAKSDEVSKAEKKLDNLKKDQAKLERKIKDLQADLQSNTKSQESQSVEIESLKKALDDLKNNPPGE